MFESPHHNIRHNKIIFILGVVIALGFWLGEGMLHLFILDRRGVVDMLLPSNIHELWMRTLVTCTIIGFSIYVQLIINKLHENKERFQALFESAPDAIFLADVETGEILDANPTASRLLLRRREEIIGLHQSQLHPPVVEDDSKRIFTEYIEHIKQGKDVQPVEHVVIRSDGAEVPVEIAAQTVPIKGKPVLQGTFRDLTERKKTQKEMENANERFRTVLDSLDAIVYVADMETHEILFTNKYGRDIWGNIEGKTCWKTLQADKTGPCEFCTSDKLINNDGEPTGVYKWELQNTINRQWYDCHDQAIQWTDGRLVRMEIATNITERKQKEKQIKKQNEFLNLVLESLGHPFYVIDAHDYTIKLANSMARMGSISEGLTCHSFSHRQDRPCEGPENTCPLEEVKKTKQPMIVEHTHYDKNDNIKEAEVRAYPVINEQGDVVKVIEYCLDITERKKAEEALRRQSELLDSIRSAQSLFITGDDPKPVFEALLKTLVEITDSEYGFLDEVQRDENGRLFKKSLALSNISWDEGSRKLYEHLKASNLEFQDLNNLAGAPAVSGELVISNDPADEPRSGSLPEGHPPIRAFMGIPMFFGGELVGVAGVANRDGGYNEEIASFLETFISTCASIIQAVRDGRQRRKIAKELAENEEKYRRVVEDQMELVVRWLPDGTRTFVNDSYCRYFGIPRDQAIGTSLFPLITEDYREAVRNRIESSRPEDPASTGELKVIRPDGTIGWNQWTDRAIFDEEGKLIEFQSVGRDVTERKIAEEQLAIFKKFAEASTQGLGIADLEGRIVYCNNMLCHGFLGEEEPQKAFGKHVSYYYDEKSAKKLQEQILPLVLDIGQWTGEIPLVSVSGKVTEAIQSIFLIRNDKGEPAYFANIVTDITERKQTEQQLHQNAEQLGILLKTNKSLSKSLDLMEILQILTDSATEILDGGTAAVYLLKEDLLYLGATTPPLPPVFPDNLRRALLADHPHIQKVINSASVLVLPDAKTADLTPAEREISEMRGLRTAIFFPLTGSKGIIGAYIVASTDVPRQFPESQINLCHTLGSQASIAIENARLYQSVQDELKERQKAEAALQESENRYRGVVENAGEGIAVTQDRIIRFINPYFTDVMGYSEKEIMSRPFIEFVHPDDREWVMEIHMKRFKGEEILPFYEFRAVHKQGNTMWLENNGILIEWDGRPASLNFLRDITSRKKAEEALREERDRAQNYLDVAGVMFVHINKEGNVTLINKKGCDILGYQEEEIVGKNWFDNFLPERDGETVKEVFFKLIASKIELVQHYENPILTKDGKERIIAWHNTILRDEGGEILGTLSSGEDVTERKKSEAALAKSEQKFRKFFENEPEYCYMVSSQGTILEANHAALNILGYTIEELAEKSLMTIYASESHQRMHQLISQWEQTGEIRDEEMVILTKNGERRTVLLSAAQMLDEDGKPLYSISIQRDITERKEAAEALREERDKLQALMDGTNRAGISIDIIGADYEVLFQNKVSMDSCGKLEGKTCYEGFMAFEKPCEECPVAKAINENKAVETEQRGSDGGTYHVIAAPLPDADGNVSKAIELVLDITERKKAEIELEKQRYYLAKAQEMGKIGTWELDIEKNKLVWTDEVFRIFGLDIGAELTYETFLNSVHHDDREYVDQKWKAALNAEPYDIEHRLLVDGGVKWVREKASVQFGKNGSPVLAIGFTQDITERKRAELALQESEERYRSFVQNFQGIAYRGTMDFMHTFFHGAVEEITGYTEDEFIAGKPRWDKLIHPDDLPVLLTENEKKLHTLPNQAYEREYRIVRKDGQIRWIQEIIQNIGDDSDRHVVVQGAIHDITERKMAEQALRDSERFLQNIFDGIRDGISILDRDLNVVRVNKWMEEMYGNEMSLLGRKCYEVYHRRESVCPWCPSVRTLETGEVNTEIVPYPYAENPTNRIELSAFPLKGADGSVMGVIEHVKDVTERLRAEEELRESEKRFRSLSEAAFEGIAFTENGVLVDANEAFAKIYDCSLEELKGSHVIELVALEHRKIAMENMRSGHEGIYEHKGLRQDGNLIDLEIHGRDVEYQGRRMRLTAIRDITEHKLAERKIKDYQAQLKSLASELSLAEERERRRIATGIHDDIAQKLAMAKFSLQSLQASIKDTNISVSLEKQCQLMSQVVADARSLTFELGNPVLYQVGLEAAVESYLIERIQDEFGIKCKFKSEGPKSSLEEDVRVVLFQAVRELLANVIKHANASTIEVCVRKTEDSIKIIVKDDGVGFDPNKIGPHTLGKGGFGLFNIRERLEYFGGSLELESRPKCGTRAAMTVAIKADAVAEQKEILS